jgi:hypothetical protein
MRGLSGGIPLPWRLGVLLVGLMAGSAVLALGQTTPLVLNKYRDLNFGYCDATPNMSYVVDPADNPGLAACPGATSAWIEVVGDPNARIAVTADTTVTVVSGTATLTVKPDPVPSKGVIRLDATGKLNIYVGGSVKIPPGGTTTYGPYTAPSTLTVVYK